MGNCKKVSKENQIKKTDLIDEVNEKIFSLKNQKEKLEHQLYKVKLEIEEQEKTLYHAKNHDGEIITLEDE